MPTTTMNISSENTWTDAVQFGANTIFNLSVSGTFQATVQLQRSYDGETWHDVPEAVFLAPDERCATCAEASVWWRIGVKTDAYRSGTATVRLGQ